MTTTKVTPGTVSSAAWAGAVLAKAGLPVTATNVSNIERVITGESAGQQGGFLRDNNPLNLNTWASPHSSLANGQMITLPGAGGETVYVQQFYTLEDGITATANELKDPGNAALYAALKNSAPASAFGAALGTSSWKTGGYASAKGILNYAPADISGGAAPTSSAEVLKKISSLAQSSDPLTTAASDVKSTLSWTEKLGQLLGDVLNPNYWKNILVFVAGLGLAVTGLVVLFSASKSGQEAREAALKAV